MTTSIPQQTEDDPRAEVERLVRSRFGLIFIESSEELRAEHLVTEAAKSCQRPAWTWSLSEGLLQAGNTGLDKPTSDPITALRTIRDASSNTSVYAMHDMSSLIATDKVIERLVRDIALSSGPTLVMIGRHGTLPPSVSDVAAVYVLPRPNRTMVNNHVRTTLGRFVHTDGITATITEPELEQLVNTMLGLTLQQIDQVLMLLVQDGVISYDDLARAVERKADMLAKSGVLTLESPTLGLEWLAGFDNVKRWAAHRAKAFTPEAKEFGIEAPRGLLLTGVPGCGKSFAVKALAAEWKMPLLRLDAGSLYDSFIGSSERNLRESLATAEALAPSVLWIDEIEKGFGSSGSSDSDGGLSYRMLGTLATWMQDRPAPVLMLATSNDITKLPPELTRQGRFDEIFFVDLPSRAERVHLFMLMLAQKSRDHDKFDCEALADASEGFSGAEVEQAVTNALYVAFADAREVTTDDIAAEARASRPLSTVNPMAISAIRDWGKKHARPA